MKVEVLKSERINDFVSYCIKHRGEIDDSFLYDKDLRKFKPDNENPTYILINEQEEIMGTASLIINDYNRRGKRARFRIFHTEIEDIQCYRMLFEAILKHTEGLDKIFIFVSMENKKMMEFIEGLNFAVERYSFLLVRENLEVPQYSLPEGYEIKTFRPGSDEEAWCEVRNTAFAHLQGSETPITPEMVAKMISEEDYIEGELMILYHGEKTVGVVRGAADIYEEVPIMNIGPLAIIPEYQGKGLGRILLRASLKFSKEKSYDRTVLCVNADNDRAKSLYIQEGFKEVQGVTCYKYDLKMH